MKKFFYYLIIATSSIFISACSKVEDPAPTGSLLKSKMSSQGISPMAAMDGVYDLLGYGYDVIEEYANPLSARFQVLDIERFQADYPTRVESTTPQFGNGSLVYGSNIEEYSQSLSMKINATVGFKLFGGTINASYSAAGSNASKYIYSTYDHYIRRKHLKFNGDYELLRGYLTASFIADLQNSAIEALVERYGTHVLTNIELGGKLHLSYQSQTSSENRTSAAEAGVNVKATTIFSINTNVTTNSSAANSNYSQNLSFKTYGGDPSIALMGSMPVDGSTPTINIAPWQNSVTVQNSQLISIAQTGLIPLYELVADPIKKIALQNYINQYLTNNQVQMTHSTHQLYRCYNATTNNRLLTSAPNEVEGLSEWQVEGPFAKVYVTNSKPGLVPLYRFFLPNNTHLFSLNRYEVSGASGTYEAVVGYIHSTQVPGTIPLYRYYNLQSQHMFARDWNELGQGKYGWIYEGTLGYMLP